MIKYEWRLVLVCKLMNGELSGHAQLQTENCPPVQISRTEKCPDGDLSGPRLFAGNVTVGILYVYLKMFASGSRLRHVQSLLNDGSKERSGDPDAILCIAGTLNDTK